MKTGERQRVALVTGGTRGFGAGIVRKLVEEGWSVVATARNAPQGSMAELPHVSFVTGDIRQPDCIDALVAYVAERHGHLDLLVNNAGGAPEVDSRSVSRRLHDAVIALNLSAPLHLSQACYPLLRAASGGGAIVNIASVSGVRPSPGTAAYGAAKAGLLSLTRSLAMEWAPDVRVNAIIAGLGETEAALNHYGGSEGVARVSARLPMGRMARGEDLAAAILFLASPAAAYVTGAEIAVHGGGEPPAFLELARGD